MIYSKQIKLAYGNLPILTFADLRYADVVNTTPGVMPFWPPWAFIKRLAVKQIVRYNKKLYPWSRQIYSDHSITMMEGPKYFEVTSPEGRYGNLEEEGLCPDRVYIVCRYKFHRIKKHVEKIPFEVVFESLDGVGYDFGQLAAILANWALGLPPDQFWPLLDFSKNKVVCSVGAIVSWLAWWLDQGERQGYPRPMISELHPERVPPALFECDDCWDVIGILKGGYLTE